MAKTIIFIHGRSFKPDKVPLRKLWYDALEWGIERDRPRLLSKYRSAKKAFAYYGDISNDFLWKDGQEYSKTRDLNDRQEAFANLKDYNKYQFNKSTYKALPGKSSLKEAFADAMGAPLGVLGLSEGIIRRRVPDMAQYWNLDEQFGSDVRARMTLVLKRAMNRDDKILVISHSLGTVVSYDTFWKFSRMGEYRDDYGKKKIDLWITLGSPLADETVKRHLRGAGATKKRRYPANVRHWENVAAQDDYIAHDQRVANDYKRMLKWDLIHSIRDWRRYNLAVRHGRSNPHSSLGYLVMPTVVTLVADWLQGP